MGDRVRSKHLRLLIKKKSIYIWLSWFIITYTFEIWETDNCIKQSFSPN